MSSFSYGVPFAPLTLFIALNTQHVIAEYIAQLSPCPMPCLWTGPNPASWTYYHTETGLNYCNKTMLFEMNLYNAFENPNTHISYRACATPDVASDNISVQERPTLSINQTTPKSTLVQFQSLSWSNASVTKATANSAAVSAVTQLGSYMKDDSDQTNSLFAMSNGVIAGLYSGDQISGNDAAKIIHLFVNKLDGNILQQRQAIQYCGQNQTSRQTFGLIIDTSGNIAEVQAALRSWNNAMCVTGDSSAAWHSVSLDLVSGTRTSIEPGHVDAQVEGRSVLDVRATCRYIQAKSGDDCDSLAQGCGTTVAKLESYNGGVKYCNDIQVGQYVCCSPGSLPNFAPKPNVDGSCYSYTVKTDDTCASIATAHQMLKSSGSPDFEAINNYNNNTWAWMGCNDLLIGENICLSPGTPPFPANIPSALCGPQVNGTKSTKNVTGWGDLNPCPLNACCDIWGQCGITAEFCNSQRASTGAPGTAASGQNGCISNCGTQVIQSSPPQTYQRVGYYENFNLARPCLNMWPSQIPSYYTVVHWAFANITKSFSVDISGYEENLQAFVSTTGFKKVVSFGGWAFSTDASTYNIFREAVSPGNRHTFAKNIVSFVSNWGLDGVDFDWEYPGEPDIPGIPPGTAEDGPNYLAFLQLLRPMLPNGTTMSVVAPASYWYLRAFPIGSMSKSLDYIVYETYDFHGQWDYGNRFSDSGCPAGNCLRSQINSSETLSAFSMITKAGVPSNKLMLGQSLYGRSFQMTTPGCWKDTCTYTGPTSGAYPGPCTDTRGYLANWEIEKIIANSSTNATEYFSEETGDILVYDSTQWVSWMKPSTYQNRSAWAQGFNFGGTSDWAMDLNASYPTVSHGSGSGGEVVYISPSIYTDPDPVVYCEPPCLFVFPPWTLTEATTISPPPVTITVDHIWPHIATLSGRVTSTEYLTATTALTIHVPEVTTTEIPVWNVHWTASTQSSIALTSSISLPPVTVTVPPSIFTSGGITKTAPATVVTYSPGPYPPYSKSTKPVASEITTIITKDGKVTTETLSSSVLDTTAITKTNGQPSTTTTIPAVPKITTVVTNGGRVTTETFTGPFPATIVVTGSNRRKSTTTFVPHIVVTTLTNSQGKPTATSTVTPGLIPTRHESPLSPPGSPSPTPSPPEHSPSPGHSPSPSRPSPHRHSPPGPPPPGPPPPGQPKGVSVGHGKPGPTASPGPDPGSICKSNCSPEPTCTGVCGCIGNCPNGGGCISDISGGCEGGGGGGGGGGGNGPASPNNDPPSSCATTATVSDCDIVCPASTQTTSCSTTCAEVVGCGLEGTTKTTFGKVTGIPAPVFLGNIDNPALLTTENPDDAAMWSSANSIGSSIIHAWFQKTTTTSANPTHTGLLYVDIFTDTGCTNLLEHTHFDKFGECYSPPSTIFKCFSLTYISEAVIHSGGVVAFKDPACYSQTNSGVHEWPNLTAIDHGDEAPFLMSSLSLQNDVSGP